MKKNLLALMLSLPLLAVACCPQDGTQAPQTHRSPLAKFQGQLDSPLLSAETLQKMGRVSDPQLSPDGSRVLYGVTYYSLEENRGNRHLFVVDRAGGEVTPVTCVAESDYNGLWLNDREILFLRGGQIWLSPVADGSQARQISQIPGGIEGFTLDAQGRQVLYYAPVKGVTAPADLYPDLPQATGRLIPSLMYRHWDHFVTEIPHSFVTAFHREKIEAGKDILEGTLFECPTLPFGDLAELCFSPDGKTLAYSCRKKTGTDYAVSTNTDIYLLDLASGRTRNLSEGMMGYDTRPLFSPNGEQMLWCSMERDGYEADKNRLVLCDLATGAVRDLTANFDFNVDAACWTPDGQGLYFLSCVHGVTDIFALTLADGSIRRVTQAGHDFSSLQLTPDGQILSAWASMARPTELVQVDPATGQVKPLTFENKALFDQLKLGKTESRWIATTDGKKMQTWVTYPPDFDPNKKYPALLFCTGGPQQTISQSWSYRWNHQLMAAHGYIVIAPNRRGTTAFGQEWCEQISGDYAGQNIQDYFSAVDALKKEAYVDGARIGAVGASYGGYSIYYLAGVHEGRFAAFISHAGIFNTEHMYMETEEIWFPHWDNGGAPWDKNPVAVKHYSKSPHKNVAKWDTPILVTHGELDYRVPVDQGMAAFNAAQLLGVPSEMLLFPDENHWILKPQNSVLWNRTFFKFLDKYLK